MTSFRDTLDTDDQKRIDGLRETILRLDPAVTEKPGAIMSASDGLVYEQDGVFKYGLTQAKQHFSFHSMVMYANPDIAEFIKTHGKGLKLQKGCVNFQSPDHMDPAFFEEMIERSAAKDFSPVIAHYKKKQS